MDLITAATQCISLAAKEKAGTLTVAEKQQLVEARAFLLDTTAQPVAGLVVSDPFRIL